MIMPLTNRVHKDEAHRIPPHGRVLLGPLEPASGCEVRFITVSALEPRIRSDERDDVLVAFKLGRGEHLATQSLEQGRRDARVDQVSEEQEPAKVPGFQRFSCGFVWSGSPMEGEASQTECGDEHRPNSHEEDLAVLVDAHLAFEAKESR